MRKREVSATRPPWGLVALWPLSSAALTWSGHTAMSSALTLATWL